ncbi:hypothetical protein RRG08_014587 [Elysia crispata]|uniref:Uncharacterized protein n=1 Tax=Elysia crispata TaxID=231223 RepID=A0AAE1BDB7_9GAST|nr:hypothetical protein RRG08_014587 [Elysia crispata]
MQSHFLEVGRVISLCLLLENLIDIIDKEVISEDHHKNLKFEAAEIRLKDVAKDNAEMQSVWTKAKHLADTDRKDLHQAAKRLEELESELAQFKGDILIKTRELEATERKDLHQAAKRLEELERQLAQFKGDILIKTRELEATERKDLHQAAKRLEELERQLAQFKGDILIKTRELEATERKDSHQAVKRLEELQSELAQFKGDILIKTRELEATERKDSHQAVKRLEELERQLAQFKGDILIKTRELEATERKDSHQAVKRLEELERQLGELKEKILKENESRDADIQAIWEGLVSLRDNSLWNRMRSLSLSYPKITPSWTLLLLLIPLLLLLLLLLLVPLPSLLWPVTNAPKEITPPVYNLDFLPHVDIKKELEEMEKKVAGFSFQVQTEIGKLEEEVQPEFDIVSSRIQRIERQIALLNGQYAVENEAFRKPINSKSTREPLVWKMLKLLPLSLPPILVLTQLLLLVFSVPLPVPLATLLVVLVVALFNIQVLLFLLLL